VPAKTIGSNIRFIEPGEGSDRESGLRLLAAEDMDLVIGVGFIFSDDITNLAKNIRTFHLPASTTLSQSTRAGMSFLRHQMWRRSSFAKRKDHSLSAHSLHLSGNRRKSDFVGGMDIPLIHKFEAGYRAV
jgi:basic membrane protein A